VIIFGSVFIKKNNQTEFFFEKKPKPNRNRVKPTGFGSVQFFREKTGSNRFGSVFRFWLGFLGFGSVFSVWLGFSGLARFWLGLAQCFSGFLSVSVRFGFFFIKPKPNLTGWFF